MIILVLMAALVAAAVVIAIVALRRGRRERLASSDGVAQPSRGASAFEASLASGEAGSEERSHAGEPAFTALRTPDEDDTLAGAPAVVGDAPEVARVPKAPQAAAVPAETVRKEAELRPRQPADIRFRLTRSVTRVGSQKTIPIETGEGHE